MMALVELVEKTHAMPSRTPDRATSEANFSVMLTIWISPPVSNSMLPE